MLASQILSITSEYLGPEAKRFLDRQVRHVDDGLVFDDIKDEHLEQLSYWVFISGKLIMNERKAQEMADAIKHLV